MKRTMRAGMAAVLLTMAVFFLPAAVFAHCDAVDGPVVTEAGQALEGGDVTPLLKWVRAEDEGAIRQAFAEATAVRKLGPEAKALADRYFFETLVRVHRAGEGAPYTGLKPAGQTSLPIVKADQALAGGSVDELARAIGRHAEEGVRAYFARAATAKEDAGANVAAGRRYVEAYVSYIHYVEGVVDAVHKKPAHGASPGHAH